MRRLVANMNFIALHNMVKTKESVIEWLPCNEKAVSSGFCPQEIGSSVIQEDAISHTKLPDGTVCEFYEEEKSTSDDDQLAMETNAVFPQQIGGILRGEDVGTREFQRSTRKRKAPDDPIAQLDGLKSSKIFAQQISKEHNVDSSSSKIGIDFEAVDSALGLDSIKLPSSRWSHTRLGRSCIMFLCWDRDLRLIKKAVLQKGSQMSLYLGDQLLADGSTYGLTYDLEGCLRLLDMFEQCKGVNGTNSIWSKRCAKYIFLVDGNQACSACKQEAKNVDPAVSQLTPTVDHEGSMTLLVSDHDDSKPSLTKRLCAEDMPEHNKNTGDVSFIMNNAHISMARQDAGLPPTPGRMNEKPLSPSDCNSKPPQAPKSQGDTKVEVAAVPPTYDSGQNTSVGSTNVTSNPGYLVVDFVVPGGASPCVPLADLKKQVLSSAQLQSLQGTSKKQRRVGIQAGNRVCWVSDNGMPIKLDLKSPRKRMARTRSAQKPAARIPTAQKPATRKATARKSTGGPRKYPMSIEMDSESEDPNPEVVGPVEDEVIIDETSESDTKAESCPENTSTDSPELDAQPPADSPDLDAQPPADSPDLDAQPPADTPELDAQPPADSPELDAQPPADLPELDALLEPVISLDGVRLPRLCSDPYPISRRPENFNFTILWKAKVS